MAFDYQREGIPHHPLVAPEVPSVKPMPQGEMIGSSLLAAFVHRAIASEQASLEQQRAMQSADMEARRLELARKAEADNFEIAKENAASLATYRDIMAPINLRRITGAQDEKLKAAADYGNYQDTINENDSRFDGAVRDLKLADATFQMNDPVGWIENYNELKNRFGTAVAGKIPRALKSLDVQADQLKVPFIQGAKTVTGTDGKVGWIGSGDGKPIRVPIEQIVRQWQNPDLRESLENGLIAAGHGSFVDDLNDKTRKIPTLDKYGNALLLKAGKAQLNRGKNEVPKVLTRPANTRVERYGGGNGSGDQTQQAADRMDTEESIPVEPEDITTPTGDDTDQGPKQGSLGPKFTPAKTDVVLQHARNALAANPGARGQILQRLQGMGISPDLLNA